MQGVAAKNDASYDLSRARASVTGSDHHRCLYCDDVPAERPHRDGALCRRPVSQCVPAFVLEPMVAKSILRHTDGVEHAPPWH